MTYGLLCAGRMIPVKEVALGDVPRNSAGGVTHSFALPGIVPPTATEVCIFTQVESGHCGHDTHGEVKVYTREAVGSGSGGLDDETKGDAGYRHFAQYV